MTAFHSVLVTGANKGIGLQFIVELVDKTKHLIATARDVEKATKLKKLAAKHPNLHILQLEMTDYTRYDSLVAEVANIVGEKGLTLSIQNAGMNIPENFEESKPESYAKVLNVNAVAPLFLTRQLMPLLRKSVASGERTFAMFISSCLGSIEMISQYKLTDFNAYRISKSALNQGVRTMANYYKDDLIEFVAFHPGLIQTDKPPFSRTDIAATIPYPATATVEESVSGMLKCLTDSKLTRDGRVICHDGQLLPW